MPDALHTQGTLGIKQFLFQVPLAKPVLLYFGTFHSCSYYISIHENWGSDFKTCIHTSFLPTLYNGEHHLDYLPSFTFPEHCLAFCPWRRALRYHVLGYILLFVVCFCLRQGLAMAFIPGVCGAQVGLKLIILLP